MTLPMIQSVWLEQEEYETDKNLVDPKIDNYFDLKFVHDWGMVTRAVNTLTGRATNGYMFLFLHNILEMTRHEEAIVTIINGCILDAGNRKELRVVCAASVAGLFVY